MVVSIHREIKLRLYDEIIINIFDCGENYHITCSEGFSHRCDVRGKTDHVLDFNTVKALDHSEMELHTSATTGDESTHVHVKKVLHQSLCIRGRASLVFLMSTLDPSPGGLFGTPKHYDSFDNSSATNHLFLPASDVELKPYSWSLFRSEPPSLPDYHGLWVYVSSAYAGHSLVSADSPKMLIESVLHACLGMWL